MVRRLKISSTCDIDIVVSGGLYFHTGLTIAGFQSRVGCLFFLVCHLPGLTMTAS